MPTFVISWLRGLRPGGPEASRRFNHEAHEEHDGTYLWTPTFVIFVAFVVCVRAGRNPNAEHLSRS
jgi:hypothetical protein